MINIYICFNNRHKNTIFIGVDPLNAFSGLLAKRLGWVKTLIFYTPDYTEKRFAIEIINKIYHFIDIVSARNADMVWCVSRRIMEVRKAQGVAVRKIYFLPNTPSLRIIGQVKVGKKHIPEIIIVGNVTKTLNYQLTIDCMASLIKTMPSIRLKIVGGGNYMSELKESVKEKGLERSVLFTGPKPHAETLKAMKEASLGLALYSGEFGTNFFGDSMKIREYLACGLPVITTNVTETAKIVSDYNAGEIISLNKNELLSAINNILKKNIQFKNNAREAARINDFDQMISSILSKLNLLNI